MRVERTPEERGRRVQLAALAFILLVLAGVLWVAYGPSTWTPASRLPASVPTNELPREKARVFVQGLTFGSTTPWAVGGALLLIGLSSLREARREDRNDDAPRLVALLVGLHAVAIAGGWIAAHGWPWQATSAARAGTPPASLYYVVTGLLALASAAQLWFGRRVALRLYALCLAVTWSWSFFEFGLEYRQFWMQVAMPSLIGAYLFSWRVSGRLLPPSA